MNRKRTSSGTRSAAGLGIVLAAGSANASIYVDFNEYGRQASETNETNYTAWTFPETSGVSMTIDDSVTFTLTRNNSVGSSVSTNWYKAGIQSTTSDGKLVCDGAIVTDGDSGGALKLTISGLSTGTHSLLTYHNGVDGNQLGSMYITAAGTKVVSSITPTNRATSTDSSAYAYFSFSATEGTAVAIVFGSNGTSSSYNNVILNGFALDVPNVAYQASSPDPGDQDMHAPIDEGSYTLSWTAGTSAAYHNVYFGTDSATVYNATTSSACYKGKQSGTTYAVSSLSNLKTYWWRVDETTSGNLVTKGNLWKFSPRHLAFPGAEGYGRYARGGRGGVVVHVTNLKDTGTGSFRQAVTDTTLGPRTIVFDVGGYITLSSRLTLTDKYVTVAGQTAPGQGICIRACPFGLSGAADAIVRFMKVRIGYGVTYDGMGAAGADHSILDHNTINWTIDESFSSRNSKNITLQRTLIAEALNVADHQNYASGTAHGYAASIGGDTGSYHHNLLAHNEGRNWSMACGLDGNGYFTGYQDIFDNVVYNWGGRTTDGGCHEVNFVNNYYKTGAASSIYTALQAQYDSFPGTQQYWCHGNIVSGHYNDTSAARNACVNDGNPDPWVDSAFFDSRATVQSAFDAYKDVLSDVGMAMPALDTHDQRNIREVLDSTVWGNGSVSGDPGLPDREADVGGFMPLDTVYRSSSFDSDGDGLPDWYETYLGTGNSSASGDYSDANADDVGDGYTNLERYLEYMATPHAEVAVGKSTTFNLAALFRGYSKTSPSYTYTSTTGLTVSISDSALNVTPTSAVGVAYLPVTVTDKVGATKTRNVAVFVTGSTVDLARQSSRPSFEWKVSRDAVVAQTTANGTLWLLDLSGRVVRQASGAGGLRLDLTDCPRGVLVGRFAGDGLNEERIIQVVR